MLALNKKGHIRNESSPFEPQMSLGLPVFFFIGLNTIEVCCTHQSVLSVFYFIFWICFEFFTQILIKTVSAKTSFAEFVNKIA